MYMLDRKLGQSVIVGHHDDRFKIHVARTTPTLCRLAFEGNMEFRFVRGENEHEIYLPHRPTRNLKDMEMDRELSLLIADMETISWSDDQSRNRDHIKRVAEGVALLARKEVERARSNSQSPSE